MVLVCKYAIYVHVYVHVVMCLSPWKSWEAPIWMRCDFHLTLALTSHPLLTSHPAIPHTHTLSFFLNFLGSNNNCFDCFYACAFVFLSLIPKLFQLFSPFQRRKKIKYTPFFLKLRPNELAHFHSKKLWCLEKFALCSLISLVKSFLVEI